MEKISSTLMKKEKPEVEVSNSIIPLRFSTCAATMLTAIALSLMLVHLFLHKSENEYNSRRGKHASSSLRMSLNTI